ncbi:MAG TPA: hypothetical protein VMR34_05400 [Candidatus Saccharimonadales bacterium]|nr:hypothetical protein [Candidatus Saccharimonadales bacterium]
MRRSAITSRKTIGGRSGYWLTKLQRKIDKFDKKLSSRPLLLTVGVLALCTLVIILRKPEAFTHAQFWAEDGVTWFQSAYNHGLRTTLFLPYSGTFSIFQRIIAYIATFLPLNYAPLFFNLSALACQLLPIFILNSKRLQPIVRYQLIAIVVSLLYVAINSQEVFVNLANVQWHFAIAAFLLLIASKPTSRLWVAFDVVVLMIAGLTGPITFPLVIIAFLVWFNTRLRHSLLNLGVLIVTSLLQLISLFIIEPGQRGYYHHLVWIDVIKMMVGQVFAGSIFGVKHVFYFYNSLHLWIALGVALAIIAYAIRKGPSWLRYANLYSLLLFVSVLFSLHPLAGVDVWGVLIDPGAGQRYWFIPIFVWLVTLLWVALAAKSIIMRIVCICLIVLFVAMGIPSSWKIAPLPNLNYQYYVSQCNQQKPGHLCEIPINPGGVHWQMVLYKH